MTVNGAAYALPTWGGVMPGTESSSLLPTVTVQDASNTGGPSQFDRNTPPLNTRVMMLPSPSANLGENGGSQHPDKRRAGNHQASIQDVAEHILLPTTRAQHGMDRNSNIYPRPLDQPQNLENSLARLLPTPKASDGEKGGPNQRGSSGDLTLPSASVRIGESTNLPSDAGSTSSAAQLPGQLNLLDAMADTD